MRAHPDDYIIENFTISTLTFPEILRRSSELVDTGIRGFYDIQTQSIEIDAAVFNHPSPHTDFPTVVLSQLNNAIFLSCPCKSSKVSLCKHQVQVLINVTEKEYFRVFFDAAFRQQKIKEKAKEFGLENELDLSRFFEIEYTGKSFEIKLTSKELIRSSEQVKEQLLPQRQDKLSILKSEEESLQKMLVFRKHKYNDHLAIELLEAQTSKDGKIKNPLKNLDTLDLVVNSKHIEEARFYGVVSKVQNNQSGDPDSDIEGLKLLAKNPLNIKFYYHDREVSDSLTASSVVPIDLHSLETNLALSVFKKEPFYEITGEIIINGKAYQFSEIRLKYNYFVSDWKTSLSTSYRLYQDSWGVLSNTIEERVTKEFSRRFEFSFSLRFYMQGKAKFYQDYYVDNPGVFYSGNNTLATYFSYGVGLRPAWNLTEKMNLALKLEYFGQSFQDATEAGQLFTRSDDKPLALSAFVVGLGLTAKF